MGLLYTAEALIDQGQFIQALARIDDIVALGRSFEGSRINEGGLDSVKSMALLHLGHYQELKIKVMLVSKC